jgi:hypothetical protein
MDWTIYAAHTKPNPLAEVLELMRIGNEHIIQLLLAGIIGVVSLGVSHIKDLTEQVQTIAIVLNETKVENTVRFNQHAGALQDHENRLRFIEQKNK